MIQRYLHYHPTADELLVRLTCKEKRFIKVFSKKLLLKGKDKVVSAQRAIELYGEWRKSSTHFNPDTRL
jgi:hypothetical protein